MKSLYLIRGAPGSGKSTLAHNLEILFSSDEYCFLVSHIEADDYFINKDGEYEFDPRSVPEAHNQCHERCQILMEKGYNVIIVSNTFTEEWQLEWYRKEALLFGYTIIELVCLSNFKSVHAVPDDTVVRMRKRLGRDLYSRLMTE